MAIRSYSDVYLNEAKRHLGVATDYLANVCRLSADRIGQLYASSQTMYLFGRGDPGIVAGMSGSELGRRLRLEIRPDEEPPAPANSVAGRSPEYWGGWALAHFQWHWCRTFRWIFARTSMSELLGKYSVYHEMDVARFLEDFMRELQSVKTEKNLRRMRLAAGYSQSRLARLSGVNIRNIQLYEQGVQDINRASASTLAALARSLSCSIEDLME
jgi:DNA-binding XRE family transcriptional regulator